MTGYKSTRGGKSECILININLMCFLNAQYLEVTQAHFWKMETFYFRVIDSG